MRILAVLLALAGCMEGGGQPVAYAPMPDLWTPMDTEAFTNTGQFQSATSVWCRPDGYGGVWCS